MLHKSLNAVRANCYQATKRPGKFEKEPIWVPYFFELLDSPHDDYQVSEGEYASLFVVDDDDREVFPELQESYAVCIWTDSQGFVYGEALASQEAYEEKKEYLGKAQEEYLEEEQ